MKIQLYHIKSGDEDTPNMDVNDIIGGLVFEGDHTNVANGFIYSYNKDTDIFGFCLFDPQEIPEDIMKDVLYYEEEVDVQKYLNIMFETNPSCREKWAEMIGVNLDE